jgi:hypothetical protein
LFQTITINTHIAVYTSFESPYYGVFLAEIYQSITILCDLAMQECLSSFRCEVTIKVLRILSTQLIISLLNNYVMAFGV